MRHPLHQIRELVYDLGKGQELGWRLFLRNQQGQYRQTLLGYVWAVLPPLMTTLIWVVLQSFRVVNFEAPERVPYVVYVLAGTILWQLFLNALNAPIQAIGAGREMLTKLNFPRESLLIAGLGQVLFNFAMQIGLLAIVLMAMRVPMPPTAPLFFVGSAMLLALGLGLGLVLTPIGLLYTDVQRAISTFAPFMMYLTPVLYQPPTTGNARLLVWLNPIAPILNVARDWLLIGSTRLLPSFLTYSAIGLILTLVGLLILRASMPFLIERMGS
ncbi:ABC transporter permease (plasmid) [Tundrisphaera lichenicola]|uniref:ABC transporter permease n=1 Tax=Tundrisphaera lichenicola TaxID=2029860 RepID=UPI003EBFA9F6